MLSRYLLHALCAVSVVFANPIPKGAQVPILSEQQQRNHAKPEHMGVMIAYKRSGESHEATFQFPLRHVLRGCVLHNDPWSDGHKSIDSMKILAVLDVDTAISGSLEELEGVRCRIEPEFDDEEISAASASGVELGALPTFGFEDGVIILDRSQSRWFLAGRSIKSIECW